MARVDKAEIERKRPQIEEALEGMVYGRVEIEIHNGQIRNVDSVPRRSTLRNGQPVGSPPCDSNE